MPISRLSYVLSLMMMLLPFVAVASSDSIKSACPLVKIEVERLPDLNIPRNGHSAVCMNGEVTVFGGHTTNFVLTPTAEYYKDGEWHLMDMAYPHDNGLCMVLRSGKVLLAGGSAESMGVGQSYPVEEYDLETHTFRGFSILSMKRMFASGVELDSGRVVVSGNWYAGDAIEMFDGDRTFSPVKDVAIGRAVPYMLRTSDGDVLILGNENSYGKPIGSDGIERLKGETFCVPLLKMWQPLIFEAPFCGNLSFIGDESKGDCSYLIAMQEWSEHDTTAWKPVGLELAFMLVRDTVFSLLPTTCPVPKTGVSPSDSIIWYSPLIADRKAHRGYVHGVDLLGRSYVLCVEYNKRPAPITLYYTDPLTDAGSPMIVLTDDGDLMLVGGYNFNKRHGGQLDNDNFSPLASVYLLHLGGKPAAEAVSSVAGRWWIWLLALLAIIAIIKLSTVHCPLSTFRRRRAAESLTTCSTDSTNDELMRRICTLMEEQKLYLNSELKLNDVADALNTNRNLISSCINSQQGCSFSQFVNSYRVEYAKDLIRRKPDMKISEVWMQSGFSTETSFFRTFKAVTGMTPTEWKSTN